MFRWKLNLLDCNVFNVSDRGEGMLCLREIFYIVKGYYYIVNFINVYMCMNMWYVWKDGNVWKLVFMI